MDDASTAVAAAASTTPAPAACEERLSTLNLAVMANRMDAICREMTNTVLHSARSAVIGIARDFSCAIITSDHEVLATAEAMPIHVFGMHIQTTIMSERHPDFREGDAFLDNDPLWREQPCRGSHRPGAGVPRGRAFLHRGRQGASGGCGKQPAHHLFRGG